MRIVSLPVPAPEKSECGGSNVPLSQPTGHTEGGGPKVPTNIAPNDVGDKLLRDARHTKRELLGKIFEISRELSGFSISDDVSELRDKIGILEREVDQFFDLISKKELQFSELGQQISEEFGYLKNKIKELEEQPILPCDSVSAVSETSNASSCALAQIDLDLKKKELEYEAKHAQLALELGLKEARLDAEERKLDVLNRSRSASRCNSKVGSRVSSSLGSHGSFWDPTRDCPLCWKRLKKVILLFSLKSYPRLITGPRFLAQVRHIGLSPPL